MEFPSVLLFPEGTTTNGRTLISFKLGAFAPGFPIQPVVIRYPFVHFDVSWYVCFHNAPGETVDCSQFYHDAQTLIYFMMH